MYLDPPDYDDVNPTFTSKEEILMKNLLCKCLKLDVSLTREICRHAIGLMKQSGEAKYNF